jgi:hypothetical protein
MDGMSVDIMENVGPRFEGKLGQTGFAYPNRFEPRGLVSNWHFPRF